MLSVLGKSASLLLAVLSCGLGYAQQQITIDWSSKPRSLISYPTEVNGQTPVVITVYGVNDYLYTYTQAIQGTPRSVPSDAALVFTGPGAVGGCSVAGADAALPPAIMVARGHGSFIRIDEGRP